MKRVVVSFVFCFCMLSAFGQKVQGLVSDKDGGLLGVNVTVKGSQTGTQTDFDGNYTIKASEGSVLVFSFVGYKTVEQAVKGDRVDVLMEAEASELSEVVVTGYGTQTKESITGSVSVVNLDQVRKMPDGNALTALQGRVTGIQIGKTGGPGGENVVRIRGYSNVSTNDPLYIIDGTPTQDGSIFNAINPGDIESVQVLKDAASAAIYGSRANNGVIIVTTKSGASTKGETQVNASYYIGIQTPRTESFPQFLNPTEQGNWLWERAKNAGTTPNNQIYGNGHAPVMPAYLARGGAFQTLAEAGTYNIATNAIKKANVQGTDWLSTIMQPSTYQNASVSVAKSSDKSTFYFSSGYYKNNGVVKYTGFERFSSRINTSFKITDFLTIGENLSVSYNELQGDPVNQNETGPIFMAMRMNPIIPVYDIAGNFGGTAGQGLGNAHNPLALLYRNKDDKNGTFNLLGNAFVKLDFSKWVSGLGAEVRANIDYSNVHTTDFVGKALERSEPQIQNLFREATSYGASQTYTGLLKYTNTFGKSQVTGLAGIESIFQSNRSFNATRYNLVDDSLDFRYIGSGAAGVQLNDGIGNQVGLFSLFFKGDYNYSQKYFLSVIMRNDESSRFSGANKSRLFPSIGAAWRLSEENFLKDVTFLSNLKLRASWGQTGNQSTSLAYPAYALYTINSRNNDYDISGSSTRANLGLSVYQAGNPDLRWEVVSSTDLGLEASFFKNKLTFEGGYYHKQTDDMLVQVTRPGTQGVSINPWQNVGAMLNQGFEFAAGWSDKLQNGISYSASLNFSRNVNRVLRISDNDQAFIPGRQFRANTITRISKDRPISYFYGYEIDKEHPFYTSQAEVDATKQQTGAVGGFRYKDVNGDGKVDENDRTMIGSPLPDFIYGINLSIGYKKVELSAFFEGQQGNKVFNQARYFTDFDNFAASALNRRALQSYGKVSNPIVPYNSTNVTAASQTLASSYFVEDASFLRVRNIRLLYTFENDFLKKIGTKQLMLYFQIENAYVFTKYTGMDPEINVQGVNANLNDVSATVDTNDKNYNLGIDQGAYPNPRSYVFGVNINI